MIISDLVLLKDLPTTMKESVEAYVGCIAGAEKKTAYIEQIKRAGFRQVQIVEETPLPDEMILDDSDAEALMKEHNLNKKNAKEILNSVVSVKISAIKAQN